MKKDHQVVPIKCTGIAAVLLKKCNDECKVLLLKRAAPPLKDAWCYKFISMAVFSRPGNDEVLEFIEKHFVKKKPSIWLYVGGGTNDV